MARIPYPDTRSPDTAMLVERIVAERGKMLNLYSMLLYSPPVCAGWLAFLTAIRKESSLPARIRELVIMRIAIVNGADYEFQQHQPIARSVGISDTEIDALRATTLTVFGERDQTVLCYCDAMTREVHVADDVFKQVNAHFCEREIVELTATIAAYNLVSRFLEALQVDHD